MRVRVGYVTSKGRVRLNNEDNILVCHRVVSVTEKVFYETCESDSFLFAVADGMGGHSHGGLASQTVLKSLKGTIPKSVNGLKRKIEKAKENLEKKGKSLSLTTSIGTTLSGMITAGNRSMIFHSGDSRIYRLREGTFQRLTKDHTYVQSLVDKGQIEDQDIRFHPQKNLLLKAVTSSLNSENDFYVIFEEILQAKDVYLLCTDGLWETMSDEEIFEILSKEENKIEKLFEKSFENGKDNISMVLVELETI